ncbi:hypothetical protein BDZ88DRAFT_403230 [Geranomyces variabilis]|nr:hypothetical protein BDZ88DRAFT_403230 [Geranomyces variabilis]KAJ3141714.1 hypothetical protein HDU90_006057 [Geranomyces variabilis]
MSSVSANSDLALKIQTLITASNTSVLIPDPFFFFTPLQCFGIIDILLPVLAPMQKEVAVAGPLAMIGMCQIIFGALPTLFSKRAQWRRPLYILSVASALFYLAAMIVVVDGERVFYIDWQRTFAIDLTAPFGIPGDLTTPNMLGWYYKRDIVGNAWTRSFPILVGAGQVCYETAAAIRASMAFVTEKNRKRWLYAATAVSCVCHIVVPWTMSMYSVAKGSDKWMEHQDKFSHAGLADMTLGVAVEIFTNLTFLAYLANGLSADKDIVQKLATSPGAFRLILNIGLAIATLALLGRENFSQYPTFSALFCLWSGWQINTFIQFSFVDTMELIADHRSQIGSPVGPTKVGTVSLDAARKPSVVTSVAESPVELTTPRSPSELL